MNWRTARNGICAAGLAIGLLALVWLSDAALRDPRVVDGWMIFTAMTVQILFSWRRRMPGLPAGQVTGWMQAHIYCGYIAVVLFAMHTQLTLPDSSFEWALWLLFVLVALSGIIGAFLTRSIPARLHADAQTVPIEAIVVEQAKIAREVDDLVIGSVSGAGTVTLTDIYSRTLHRFFRKPRNILAHLAQSSRPLDSINTDLATLDRHVDDAGKAALKAVRDRVAAKNDLDYQFAHQGLLVAWLFVHVPATYGLIVLSVVHVAIIYAYTSGA